MHTARDTGRARALPTTPDTSRRRLFATAAGALVAGATVATTAHGAPIAEPSGGDAELLTACRDFLAADCRVKESDAEDWEDDATVKTINDAWYNALERLTALPARTVVGMQAKADAAYLALASALYLDMKSMEREEWAALSVLADLTGRPLA